MTNMKSNILHLAPKASTTLAPAGTRERYRQYPTIAEAALIWSGLSFSVLDGCQYLAPCVPDIPGHPEVAARAEAILEATIHGDLKCVKSYERPRNIAELDEYLPEILEKRTVARKELLAWIAATFPDEMPGSAPRPATATPGEVKLSAKEVLNLVRRSGRELPQSTLYAWSGDGRFPSRLNEGTKDKPKYRWKKSDVEAWIIDEWRAEPVTEDI